MANSVPVIEEIGNVPEVNEEQLKTMLNDKKLYTIISETQLINSSNISDADVGDWHTLVLNSNVSFSTANSDVLNAGFKGIIQIDQEFLDANPQLQPCCIGSFLVFNENFKSLAEGETVSISFDVVADDGKDKSEAATVCFNIIGSNDEPEVQDVVIQIDETNLADVPSEDFSYSSVLTSSDVDGNSATYSYENNLKLSLKTTSQDILLLLNNNSPEALVELKEELVQYLNSPLIQAVVDNSANLTALTNAIQGATSTTQIVNFINANPNMSLNSDGLTFSQEISEQKAQFLASQGVLVIDVQDNGNYTISSPLFNSLAAYESVKVEFDYKANDGFDDSNISTVSLNVQGTNDLPVIENIGEVVDTNENDLKTFGPNEKLYYVISETDLINNSNISDEDINDWHTLVLNSNVTFNTTNEAVLNAQFKGIIQVDQAFLDANPDVKACVGSFLIFNDGFKYLKEGEVVSVSFDVVADDGTGKSLPVTVNSNVIGQNDILEGEVNSELIKVCDIQVNSCNVCNQYDSSITALEDGGYVVTWTSSYGDGWGTGIFSQRYDANGKEVGEQTQVNSCNVSNQCQSSSTGLANGGYVVTWTSSYGDGWGTGIFAQVFDENGQKVGNEIKVNSWNMSNQAEPTITALEDGGYVISWTSNGQDSWYSKGIFAQRFDENGQKIGNETQINTYTRGEQYDSSITALEDGGYVVTWTSPDSYYGVGIYSQRFDENGQKVGNETRVNTTTRCNQYDSDVTGLEDGGYVVTWTSNGQDGWGTGIFSQKFDLNGQKVGDETQVNEYEICEQSQSSIASLEDGGYVVTWTSYGQDGWGTGIFAQKFDENGQKVGNETQVNSCEVSDQCKPSVTGLEDGGYVVTWTSNGQDGWGTGIFTQRFDEDGNAMYGVQENTLSITNYGGEYEFSELLSLVSEDTAIDKIDLSSDGEHILSNLSIDDFISITDGDDILMIDKDENDSVSLNSDEQNPTWLKQNYSSVEGYDEYHATYVPSNSSCQQTLKVLIEQDDIV